MSGWRASTRLALRREQVATLRHLAEMCYPYEACGFLVGRRVAGGRVAGGRATGDRGPGDEVRVDEVLHGRNVDAKRAASGRRPGLDQFRLDPQEVLDVERAARRRRRRVVGFWHSHPDAAPLPSAADARAAWRDRSYLIVSIDPLGQTVLRSYRADRSGLDAEPITLL